MNIQQYTLQNEFIKLSFINIGATITEFVNLSSGINIIMGHHDINSYLINNIGYMNSTIGRHSGRLTDFLLDGTKYKINKNINNYYQLHGGINGFNSKIFQAKLYDNQIKFLATSIDGEEGFPGEVNLTVTYELVDDELHITYEAISSKKTIMSFTNHAYFNLTGNPHKTILDHELFINANYYLELDETMIPVKLATVNNTPLDFRKSKRISTDINKDFHQLQIAGGFDHPFLLNKSKNNGLEWVAKLSSIESNLALDIYSTQEAVVFYSGNMMNSDQTLQNSIPAKKHNALCLETQGIPNSINIGGFKHKNIYDPHETYYQKTIWKLNSLN